MSHEVKTESFGPKFIKKLQFSESLCQPICRGQHNYIKRPLAIGGVQDLQKEYRSYRGSPGDLES